jgi:S1-C subfamily serine protease
LKTSFTTALLCLSLAAPALAQEGEKQEKPQEKPRAKLSLADFEDAVLEVADKVRPAVVAIDASHEGEEKNVIAPRRVSLSGVIWDAEGLIVAVGRDLESAQEITVTPLDGEPMKAKLEGIDDETGVVVLRVENAKGLKPLERGASDKLRPGSFVVSVGNPLGLRNSVAFGTVAGVGRTVKRGPFMTKDAIQLTVPVNPGDPGGLVADSRGRLVGLLASSLRRAEGVGLERDLIDAFRRGFERFFPGGVGPEKGPPGDKPEKGEKDKRPPGIARRAMLPDELFAGAQGISFALTVEEVARAVERVKGETSRPRPLLGVDVLPVDDSVRKALGLEVGGVLVIGVRDGSAAAKADLRAKDVVLTYNGAVVRDVNDLRHRVRESAVGAQVKVEIIRDGVRATLDVTLEGRKP